MLSAGWPTLTPRHMVRVSAKSRSQIRRRLEQRSVLSPHKFNNQAWVNGEGNFDSLNSSQMSPHLYSDVHERVNEIPIVTKPFSVQVATAEQTHPPRHHRKHKRRRCCRPRHRRRRFVVVLLRGRIESVKGFSLNRSQCDGCSTTTPLT